MDEKGAQTFEEALLGYLDACIVIIKDQGISENEEFNPFFNISGYVNALTLRNASDNDLKLQFHNLFEPHIAAICVTQDFSFLDCGIVLHRHKVSTIDQFEYYFDISRFWGLMRERKEQDKFIYHLLTTLCSVFPASASTLSSIAVKYSFSSTTTPTTMISDIFGTVKESLQASGYADKLGSGTFENINCFFTNVSNKLSSTAGGMPDTKSMVNNILGSKEFIELISSVQTEETE